MESGQKPAPLRRRPSARRTGWRGSALLVLHAGLVAAQPDEQPPEAVEEATGQPTDPRDVEAAATPETESVVEVPPEPPTSDAATIEELEARVALLEAMSAESMEAAVAEEALEDKFRTYGFMDAGMRAIWLNEGSNFTNLIGESPTFLLGAVNIYFDANPVPHFRSLTEVRFTLYPHGVEGDNFQATNNRILDTNSATGHNSVVWSGIVLERAWIEWNRYAEATIRAGYFLTPYGIWNVDHGAPTLISSVLPGFFAEEYFPTHQLGVQLLGNFPLGGSELAYAAYISNGRSPTQADTNDNKNIGGRVAWSTGTDWRLTLGTSAFVGDYLEEEKTIVSFDPFRVDADKTVAYDEWGFGGDVSLDIGETRVRAEIVANHTEYEPGYRAAIAPGVLRPDQTKYNTYVLVAHELPWFGLEPYMYLEYEDRESIDSESSTLIGPGLNVRFNPAAHLKAQYFHVAFAGDRTPAPANNGFQGVNARLVLAF